MERRELIHDIRSNHQIVTNFLRLLEKKFPNEEAKQFVDIVINANKKVQTLINELLENLDE